MVDSRPPMAKPQLTVDVVVFTVEDKTLKVLLLRRDEEPFKDSLTLPGGFLWQGETSAEAGLRILKNKTNVQKVFFEQLYTFDDPARDPRGRIISITYFALVPAETLRRNKLATSVELVAVADATDLGFDHNVILKYAIGRLRSKLGYSNIAYSLLPAFFTLSQLQEIYEVILGHPVDKRNFRKKIQSLDVIEPTQQKLTGERHRPARLFCFKKRGYAEHEDSIF